MHKMLCANNYNPMEFMIYYKTKTKVAKTILFKEQENLLISENTKQLRWKKPRQGVCLAAVSGAGYWNRQFNRQRPYRLLQR